MNKVVLRSAMSIAAVAVVAAGCGASSDDANSAESGGVAASPLAELLGWNTDRSPAEDRAKQLEVEEAVAACMRAEGFEYVPVDYEAQSGGGISDEDAALSADPQAYGEKYGYGVVFNYEQYEEPYLSGDGESRPGFDYVDPNQEYLDSLSENERQAYEEVLWGVAVFEAPAEESVEDGVDEGVSTAQPQTAEEMGCQGSAQLEVFGDQIVVDPEIGSRIDEFFRSTEDDPEIQAAERDWLDCLAGEAELGDIDGFEVTSPDSIYEYLSLKKAIAQGKEVAPIDPATGEPTGGADYEGGYSSFENEDGTGWAYFGPDEPIKEDALEELRRFELDLWNTDWSCQQEVDMRGVRERLEQRLVDDLLAEFPDLGNADS